MTEALAERLLDLHCRLLSLYIIQDADCLNWECNQPFFESERGSYTIQMWWLYMQGTKNNLWNSVPPNMAQRVYAGMLNETLSLLTVRYTQTVPSQVYKFDEYNLRFGTSYSKPHRQCRYDFDLFSRFIKGTWTHGDLLCRIIPFIQYGNIGVSLLCIAMITINRREATPPLGPSGEQLSPSEEVMHLRRQVTKLNRRVLAVELDNIQRQQRDKIVYCIGLAYFLMKAIVWLNRN